MEDNKVKRKMGIAILLFAAVVGIVTIAIHVIYNEVLAIVGFVAFLILLSLGIGMIVVPFIKMTRGESKW